MELSVEKLSQPVKVISILKSTEVKERKEKAYNIIKNSLPAIKGFRKGHITRDIAEKKFSTKQLYKDLIDNLYYEIISQYEKEQNVVVISTNNFKLYGDLSDEKSLKVEFVVELEPTVIVPELDSLTFKYEKEIEISENEIQDVLNTALKENEKQEDVVDRDDLMNLDIAIIDFEGSIKGEQESFKGGSAKNYTLTINIYKKTFVDDFEDQMIGMRKGETKIINVTFPDDYRDKSKAGKEAIFKVTLNQIKRTILPELNEEFIKQQGFNSLEEYKKDIKQNLCETKKQENVDNLKRDILREFLNKSEFSPIPNDIVDIELNNEWKSFLIRIGKKEEEYLKENPNGREHFNAQSIDSVKELIKTSLVLKELARKLSITVSKEEVYKFTMNISTALKFNDDKKENILKDLDNDERAYKQQEKFALNEKIIEFLISYYSK
jgi:trigger factor